MAPEASCRACQCRWAVCACRTEITCEAPAIGGGLRIKGRGRVRLLSFLTQESNAGHIGAFLGRKAAHRACRGRWFLWIAGFCALFRSNNPDLLNQPEERRRR